MEKHKRLSHQRERVSIKSELLKNGESVKVSLKRRFGLNQILGKSKIIQKIHENIDKISQCDVTALITGESGTGKEIAARAIHYLSRRAGKPFIPVNCGAIPEQLFENELFGHIKGAYTDARLQQNGLVTEADGGTLFLDEISTITPFIQAKLLRLLQDKEFKPLGDPKPRKANIRLIAATNRNLEELLKEGKFRDDLYYRLNIISLSMPPLRERKEDIPILVDHFINKYSKEYNKPFLEISNEAMDMFISYSWPGNIRELENKIQHIIVMFNEPVLHAENIQFPKTEQMQKEIKLEYFKEAKQKVINSFEKTYLIQLLQSERGNMVQAARKAGKSRTALWNLLKKYNLSPKQFR